MKWDRLVTRCFLQRSTARTLDTALTRASITGALMGGLKGTQMGITMTTTDPCTTAEQTINTTQTARSLVHRK